MRLPLVGSVRRRAAALLCIPLALLAAGVAAAAPLRIVASTPELGSLVREIGGDRIRVSVLARPGEDPHFVEAKPSFVKELNAADAFVVSGMDMEMGYAPVLLTGARNAKVLPGNAGYIDASVVVQPLEAPVGAVDRSMGDVHPAGNPHYLLDPLMGLKVAALLRDAFSGLAPADAVYFAQRYDDFRRRLNDDLVGPALAKKYDAEKLALLFEYGKLTPFLEQRGEAALLGGWLGALAPYAGATAVDDHPMWPYFARRFGLRIVGHLEPKPGVPPTTKHLQELVATMKTGDVRLVLANAYYDPRHADFIATETGARVARMANQAGARPGTEDYLSMVNYNVEQVVQALRRP